MNTLPHDKHDRVSSGRSLRKSALGRWFVVAFSVVLALFMGETLVRLVKPQQLVMPPTGLYRPDPVFGWRLKEGLDTVINTGERPVRFLTDADGYRIPTNTFPRSAPADSSASRVLTIGDSFLEAASLDFADTIPELLKAHLSDVLPTSVIVNNDSAAGWDPNQYYFAARAALARQSYDVGLVFLYLGNDITAGRVEHYDSEQVARRHDLRLPLKLTRKEWVDALLYPVNDFLKMRSHLFVLFKNQLQVPLARLGLTAMYFPAVYQISERGSSRWQVTADICKDIQAEFSKHNTPVLFIFIPAPFQVDEASFYSYVQAFRIDLSSVDLEQPNDLLGQRFSEAAIPFIDPLIQMRAQQKTSRRFYGTIDRHLTADGHRVLTAILAPVVEELIENTPHNQT